MVDSFDRLFDEALDRTEAPTSELRPEEVAGALQRLKQPQFVLYWVLYTYEDRTLIYLEEEDPGLTLSYLAKRQVSVPAHLRGNPRGLWAYVQGVICD